MLTARYERINGFRPYLINKEYNNVSDKENINDSDIEIENNNDKTPRKKQKTNFKRRHPVDFDFPLCYVRDGLKAKLRLPKEELSVSEIRELIAAVVNKFVDMGELFPTKNMYSIAAKSIINQWPHLAEDDNESGCENFKLQIRRKFSYIRRTKISMCDKSRAEFKTLTEKHTPKKFRKNIY